MHFHFCFFFGLQHVNLLSSVLEISQRAFRLLALFGQFSSPPAGALIQVWCDGWDPSSLSGRSCEPVGSLGLFPSCTWAAIRAEPSAYRRRGRARTWKYQWRVTPRTLSAPPARPPATATGPSTGWRSASDACTCTDSWVSVRWPTPEGSLLPPLAHEPHVTRDAGR